MKVNVYQKNEDGVLLHNQMHLVVYVDVVRFSQLPSGALYIVQKTWGGNFEEITIEKNSHAGFCVWDQDDDTAKEYLDWKLRKE